MGYRRQWLRPNKLRAHYVDVYVRNIREAEYQLYQAVVEGSIRARHKGRELTLQEAYALRETRWSDYEDDLYALPVDLELSVVDAKRIWGNLSPLASDDVPVQHKAHGAKTRGILDAIDHLWPDDIPEGLIAKERDNKILDWLRLHGHSLPTGARAIQRALKALRKRK